MSQIKTLINNDVSPDAINGILKSMKFKVLLVLDGFDEIDMEKHTHFTDVIYENTFQNVWLLATMQPHLVNKLKQHFHLLVENRGFSEQAVDSLLQRMSPYPEYIHDADDIYDDEYIYEDAGIYNLKQTDSKGTYFSPFLVHAALTVYLHSNTSLIDSDITDRLVALVQFILNTNKANKKLEEKDMEICLLEIMELAYKSLVQHDDLVFSAEHLRHRGTLKMGLLSEYEHSGVYGTIRRVEFIHSLIRDFLAACYIVKKIEDEECHKIAQDVLNFAEHEWDNNDFLAFLLGMIGVFCFCSDAMG